MMKFLCVMASVAFLMSGCGSETPPAVSEACMSQLTADDCEIIGNNVLSFMKDMEKFECVWQNNQCQMRSR